MKLDMHVHSVYSGQTSIYPLSLVLKESYNSPERVYPRAKARGMDLVTITDHDRFNQSLLFDLVARPAHRLPEAT